VEQDALADAVVHWAMKAVADVAETDAVALVVDQRILRLFQDAPAYSVQL
jgi:hypothetical protein